MRWLRMERPYFPMFVNLAEKKILVVGGGNVALRRIMTLLKFGADIHVIAPEICEELACLAEEGELSVELRKYQPGDIRGAQIVLAASDDRDTNHRIWEECRAAGITVNVADDRSLCDFYFPSVVMTDDAVIGINCGGMDHAKVKETRIKIEEMLQTGKTV
ncbi:MAG TPA: bifunctional precorrin-2 dehydrogenase/sirohydrochlorin ferrochelatase [Candidatus Mediterraneibacter pullistercoris]|nr:bifunctional precorrin-2 dehydrogenase/sirohydrochlorin ferrochelatase [Candidatus Mediterraneibacter pullistercoris]